ncbi:flagellar brake protein YcgR, partial [Escherichia coli 89.0511]
QNR